MSLGPLMVALRAPELTPPIERLLQAPAVGAVLLTRGADADPETIERLSLAIHALRSPRLLIAAEQEGGSLQALRKGFVRLPPAADLGRDPRDDGARARHLCQQAGWVMATELRAVGVDFAFAPLLALQRDAADDGALHADPEQVARLARAYVQGMHRAGMEAVVTGFPLRSEDAASIQRWADFEADPLLPFARLLDHGAAGLCLTGARLLRFDSEPAHRSPFWIGDVLRARLRYSGALFGQLEADAGPAEFEQMRRAGIDMVVVEVAQADALVAAGVRPDPVAHARLLRLHGRDQRSHASLVHDPAWLHAVAALHGEPNAESLDLDL